MGKHTEGPWQVKGEYVPDCLIVVANVDSDITAEGEAYTCDHIATCIDEYGESSLDAVGNARLIATAPRLLAACKALKAEFEKFSRYGSPMAMAANEAMQVANAAIREAEGS